MSSVKGTMALPINLTEEQLELGKVISLPWAVMPPRLFTVNGKAFDAVARGVHSRVVQNVGTTPIYYQIGGVVAPDFVADVPHQIIPGGTIAYDGTGGTLDVSSYPYTLWLWNPVDTFAALLFSSYHPNTKNIGTLIL